MHSRRSFLRLASTSAAALPFLPSLLQAHPTVPSAANFETLRRGVGTFTGQGGTIGWMVRDGRVVVIDAQVPDAAQACWDGLADRGDGALDLFVNTHHHADHTGGNGVFAMHTDRLLAHANVPELQRAASGEDSDPTYPTETYTTAWSKRFGDETVRLHHNGPAHTGGDTVVHFEEANVAHVGDLVFNRVYPFIDIDGGALTTNWISTLETLHDTFDDDTIVIHGHGAPDAGITGGRDDLLAMRDFLAGLNEFVAQAIEAGQSVDEIASQERLPGFEAYAREDWPLPLEACLRAVHREQTGDGNA